MKMREISISDAINNFVLYPNNKTFNVMHDRLRPGFINTAKTILKFESYQTIGDTVSDALTNIFIKKDMIKNVPAGARSVYVYTMLRNDCKQIIRKNSNRTKLSYKLAETQLDYVDEFELVEYSVEETDKKIQELSRKVSAIVESFPPLQKIYAKVYIENMLEKTGSSRAIIQRRGLSYASYRVTINKIKLILRNQLGDEYKQIFNADEF